LHGGDSADVDGRAEQILPGVQLQLIAERPAGGNTQRAARELQRTGGEVQDACRSLGEVASAERSAVDFDGAESVDREC